MAWTWTVSTAAERAYFRIGSLVIDSLDNVESNRVVP